MTRRRSRLPDDIQRRLVEHFVAGTTARTVADLLGLPRTTVTRYFLKLRECIATHIADDNPFEGTVEIDESYFGGTRKGKRGRGAAGKVPVFGLLKRGGRVYTVLVPDVKRDTLLPIIRQKVAPDSLVFTDGFGSYDTLHVSGFRHERISHEEAMVDEQGRHINGIENFWSQAKRHLRRYNGIPRQHFHLYLKECEWRFNYGSPRELQQVLLHWTNL